MCKFKVYLKVFSVENSPKNLQYSWQCLFIQLSGKRFG